MPPRPERTLIIGAGITGATIAHLLQKAKQSSRYAAEVLVWEKNNIVGGRMMARSFRKHRHVHVDIGAQYLTTFTHKNDDIRDLLEEHKKLAAFPNDHIAFDATQLQESGAVKDHMVAPEALGFRSIVEFLLQETPTQLSKELDHFEILNKNEIKVISTDGEEQIVTDLVLTCPTPQALSILRKSEIGEDRLESLVDVEYSKRFAVAYLFDKSIAQQVRDLGWIAKYVSKEEDSVIRYMCWDNLKKQSNGDEDFLTLLVHSTVPFGLNHLDDKDKDDAIIAQVTTSLRKLLPFLPAEQDVLLHRWRYSQVHKTHVEPTVPALVLHASPNVFIAGDAFLGSTFDKCVLSAKATVELLMH